MIERIADGRTDLVFDFVEAGHLPDAVDANGVSLLRWCSYYGDVSAIKFLLVNGETLGALGANLDLNGACFHGHWRLCQYLIEQGADVNQPLVETGETPLHTALSKPNMPVFDLVVEVLLSNGADPNTVIKQSAETGGFMRDCRTKAETPLHRAAAFGSATAIQFLLDAGARPEAKDMNGDSPMSWASWYCRPAHILSQLCHGPFGIHPESVRNSAGDRDAGWRGMEKSLVGKPHLSE